MHPLSWYLKLPLIVAGVGLFTAFVVYGALNGISMGWTVAGAVTAVAFAECGHLSYSERWRALGGIGAGILTGVVAGVTFFHLGLVGAGLLVTLGCALRRPAE